MLFLNGEWVANNTTLYTLAPFTVSSGFCAGTNTLDFLVINAPISGANPSGLLVSDLSGTAAFATASVTLIADPINGGGVTGGGSFNVGSQAQISATANNGWTFTGWNDGNTQNPRTITVQANGAAYGADFIFTGLNAQYAGLFYDPNGIAPQSSGAFKATLSAAGSFSASLASAGKTYSFTGRFSPTGTTSNTIVRHGQTPLTVQLILDSPTGDVLTGQISTVAWSAEITAERTPYSSANHAPQSGKYTLVIPGGANAAVSPGGDGYGAVNVSTSGSITVSGALGDGTTLSQSSTLTEQGSWPFYGSLYSGGGEIIGWLTFSNAPLTDLGGSLTWIKPSQPASKLYRGGFTNLTQAVGSAYGFTNGHAILNFGSGEVLLSGGNLARQFTNAAGVTANGKITGTNHLSLSVNTASGLFSGSIVNPATKKAITLTGAVLEKQNVAAGYFVGTNQSGEVFLGPAP
jgi:hypothetical protein